MEDLDTPEKLCELLKKSGISEAASEILKEEEISGPEFLDLSEEDLKGLKVKMGQIKKMMKLKEQYNPQATKITADPSKQMKRMDTNNLCEYLGQNGISESAIAALRTKNISGAIFLELTEEELKDMGLTVDDMKHSLRLQAENMPKTTQDEIEKDKNVQVSPPAKPRLAEKTKLWCKQISKGEMPHYELPQQDTSRSATNQIATVQVGPRSAHLASSPGKVLMVVGATGAGKTTLINAMVNYLFGVEWEDDFRFKMIVEKAAKDQTKSVTKWITAYTIPAQEGSPVPYTLTIIDTPGFGDTEGIDRDKRIVKQVKELFEKKGPGGIDQLHGIGFVAQSALPRLTHTQRYIFDSILAIFGKDIGKNVFMMITFADGQRPPVLDAVKAANISHETACKFNNSAIYSDKKDDKFDKLFWEMGMSSLQAFFIKLGNMPAISLQLTRQVLHEREHLEAIMIGLQDKIQKGLEKIEELRQTKAVVKDHEADIERNKDFEIPATVDEPHKVDLQDGEHTTNCLTCNYTCHFPCYIHDKERASCASMNAAGFCGSCPLKCHWSQHVNDRHRIEWRTITVTQTAGYLKKKYYDAKSGKSKYESIVGGLERELKGQGEEVYKNVKEAQECVQSLEKIALKPNPLGEVEYIELLIKSEKLQKKKGFQGRVDTLTKVKEQAKLLSKVTKGSIKKPIGEESWDIFSD